MVGVWDSPFRGVVRFGDDEFDSRTVCADISIAEAVFKELYETGGLVVVNPSRTVG